MRDIGARSGQTKNPNFGVTSTVILLLLSSHSISLFCCSHRTRSLSSAAPIALDLSLLLLPSHSISLFCCSHRTRSLSSAALIALDLSLLQLSLASFS
ncbi:hypothetical protein BLNAU_22233 [Blattamonas nauphoetae]|uniref:Uncharacterized protein n=1 Tax=Blattamonas nauphoetae TaxID=2049346 RepID=A0ABQ9WUM5_9EUKA|nr:hypothetical protein BLNAU_22233 [Blattamonas nauphoetae]